MILTFEVKRPCETACIHAAWIFQPVSTPLTSIQLSSTSRQHNVQQSLYLFVHTCAMSAAEPIAAAADEAAARQSSSTPPLDALAPLPSAPPLDHANAFLDPTSDFSVDAFLLSRVSGSTLSQITAELDAYGKVLRSELEDVVDRDFRGFVALGTGLKSEAPRIARLAWQRRGSVAEMEDREEGAQSGVLGLDEVRAEVEAARDDIRGVEDEVRAVMRQREQVENQKVSVSFG